MISVIPMRGSVGFLLGFVAGIMIVAGAYSYAGVGETHTVTAYVTGYITTKVTTTVYKVVGAPTRTVTVVGHGSETRTVVTVTEIPSWAGRLIKGVRDLQRIACLRVGEGIYPVKCNVSALFDWWSPVVEEVVKESVSEGGNPYVAMLQWLRDNVIYNRDTPMYVIDNSGKVVKVNGYWFKASETLRQRYGDCEDFAVAYVAMIKRYAYDNNISGVDGCVVNVKLGNGKYHSIVLVTIGEKIMLADPKSGIYVQGSNIEKVVKEFKKLFVERYGVEVSKIYGVIMLSGRSLIIRKDFTVATIKEIVELMA